MSPLCTDICKVYLIEPHFNFGHVQGEGHPDTRFLNAGVRVWLHVRNMLVTGTRFVLSSSSPAVHFDLPLIFDPLSKSSLSAVAQLHSANLHFLLQIWARSHSVWASDSLFEAAPWLRPSEERKSICNSLTPETWLVQPRHHNICSLLT